jgi:hypothetical protein
MIARRVRSAAIATKRGRPRRVQFAPKLARRSYPATGQGKDSRRQSTHSFDHPDCCRTERDHDSAQSEGRSTGRARPRRRARAEARADVRAVPGEDARTARIGETRAPSRGSEDQRTGAACDGRSAGLRAGVATGRGGGVEILSRMSCSAACSLVISAVSLSTLCRIKSRPAGDAAIVSSLVPSR